MSSTAPLPPFDMLVVGGGINGAAIACDAAGRGLVTALVEERDFAEGTSSRSSKLIHGGLRYLETYDFRLVREALVEREILLRKAPHLVWPLRLVLPHVPRQRPGWMIRLGLLLYDHLAPRTTLEGSRWVDFRTDPLGEPLAPELTEGFVYSDCRGDDARLVIANVQKAKEHGATVLARTRFCAATRDQGLWTVTLRDQRGVERTATARILVNAAGPWVPAVAGSIAGTTIGRRLRLVKGSHLVVPRLWDGDHGYYLQADDGRTMELFPYEEDFTVIGTTDEAYDGLPQDVAISDAEIDYMLGQANLFLRRKVRRSDVVSTWSGVRPLFESGGGRDGSLQTLTRDFAFEIDAGEGRAVLLTVFGGKLTTHRRCAEAALTQLARLGLAPAAGRTRSEPLPGGDAGQDGFDAFSADFAARHGWLAPRTARRWCRLYGTRARDLVGDARGPADLGAVLGADLTEREVDFLMTTEWARTAEDILWRRTKLGLRLSSEETARVDAYCRATAVA